MTETRDQLEAAALARHGPNFDPATASDEALRVLAKTPAVGQFWPGCTADESEWMNNHYYADIRHADAVAIIARHPPSPKEQQHE